MSAHSQTRLTEEQYLAIERAAEFKSEFYNGRMYAMSGASHRHAVIAANLSREIGNATKDGPCAVTTNDLRVCVKKSGLYTYPDLVVVCDPPHYLDNEFDTLLNPTLVVEVLSPSTENYDRGFKAARYREIPSANTRWFRGKSLAWRCTFARETGAGCSAKWRDWRERAGSAASIVRFRCTRSTGARPSMKTP